MKDAPAGSSAAGAAIVANPHGIHARPSHALVTAAASFKSRIELVCGGRTADARSILSVMTLGAPEGATVEVRAAGPDAEQAVATLLEILRSKEPN